MNVSRAVVRQFATKTPEVHKGYLKMKEIQQHFQKPDGKPVFLKGSSFDKILYRITMGLSMVALGAISKLFYDLSVPKKE